MNFSEYRRDDPSTHPASRGQYLIVYDDGSGLEFYMIAYYWTEEDKPGHSGFYFDQNCHEEDEIGHKWGYSAKRYMFLPNLLNRNGQYY